MNSSSPDRKTSIPWTTDVEKNKKLATEHGLFKENEVKYEGFNIQHAFQRIFCSPEILKLIEDKIVTVQDLIPIAFVPYGNSLMDLSGKTSTGEAARRALREHLLTPDDLAELPYSCQYVLYKEANLEKLKNKFQLPEEIIKADAPEDKWRSLTSPLNQRIAVKKGLMTQEQLTKFKNSHLMHSHLHSLFVDDRVFKLLPLFGFDNLVNLHPETIHLIYRSKRIYDEISTKKELLTFQDIAQIDYRFFRDLHNSQKVDEVFDRLKEGKEVLEEIVNYKHPRGLVNILLKKQLITEKDMKELDLDKEVLEKYFVCEEVFTAFKDKLFTLKELCEISPYYISASFHRVDRTGVTLDLLRKGKKLAEICYGISENKESKKSVPQPKQWEAEDFKQKDDIQALLDAKKSPYQILTIEPHASQGDIRKAFKQGSIKLHPDKNPGVDTTNQFKLLKSAREVLENMPKERIFYYFSQFDDRMKDQKLKKLDGKEAQKYFDDNIKNCLKFPNAIVREYKIACRSDKTRSDLYHSLLPPLKRFLLSGIRRRIEESAAVTLGGSVIKVSDGTAKKVYTNYAALHEPYKRISYVKLDLLDDKAIENLFSEVVHAAVRIKANTSSLRLFKDESDYFIDCITQFKELDEIPRPDQKSEIRGFLHD